MPPTPCCFATRSLFAPSWPTLPARCAPMAAALTGVHRFQPALATAPVAEALPASAEAALRATALASVPPNQAARPTSCSERDRVLRAMAGLLEMSGTGCPSVTRRFPLHASDLRTRTMRSGPAGGPCCTESHRRREDPVMPTPRETAESFSGHRFADAYPALAPDVRWTSVGQ